MGISPKNKIYADTARRLYVEKNYSLQKIAKIFKDDYGLLVHRNTVKRMLNHLGVDTSKAGSGCHRTASCRNCGRELSVTRARARHYLGQTDGDYHNRWHHYCDYHCWRVYLEEHCANQPVALRLVESILGKPLPDGAVAHFVDNDTQNVLRHNLRVFASTARHVEEHRKGG